MFLRPTKDGDGRACWDNCTIYDGGFYYAAFNTRKILAAGDGWQGYALSVFRSPDGVRWDEIAHDICPVAKAHAGYSFHKFGDRFLYHPTVSDAGADVRFETYASSDCVHWTDMRIAVRPLPYWYRARWDEMLVTDVVENGDTVYYGYISAEVRDRGGAPSCGFLLSRDGLHWEVLSPPIIRWGRVPAQHMEVSFCEKVGNKYYLGLNGRLYLGSWGYSVFVFVSDYPEGPFVPDETMFRLCGGQEDMTWLMHTFSAPDGPLCALWLSDEHAPSIPSRNFALAPFMRLTAYDGHLRMAYWNGNDAGYPNPVPVSAIPNAYSAHRDGLRVPVVTGLDAQRGFMISGSAILSEDRTEIETHHHPAIFGILLESDDKHGEATVATTHGMAFTGDVEFSEDRISDFAFYDDRRAGGDLREGRGGAFGGHLRFTKRDEIQPLGCAQSPDLRHDQMFNFRLLAGAGYYQLFIDDFYVQTGRAPEDVGGTVSLLMADCEAEVYTLEAWEA